MRWIAAILRRFRPSPPEPFDPANISPDFRVIEYVCADKVIGRFLCPISDSLQTTRIWPAGTWVRTWVGGEKESMLPATPDWIP